MNAGALAEENRRKVFKQDIHRRRIPVNRNRPADFLCVAMAIDEFYRNRFQQKVFN